MFVNTDFTSRIRTFWLINIIKFTSFEKIATNFDCKQAIFFFFKEMPEFQKRAGEEAIKNGYKTILFMNFWRNIVNCITGLFYVFVITLHG